MNETLDSLIADFRIAQDAVVEVLTMRLGMPLPAPTAGRGLPALATRDRVYEKAAAAGFVVRFHGVGVYVKTPDITCDFDWGDHGEPDGFDAWRLMRFAEDNNRREQPSDDRLQHWLNEAFEANQLTRDQHLFYDPNRRADSRRED